MKKPKHCRILQLLKSIKILIFLLGITYLNQGFSQTADFTVSIPSKQGCSPLTINYTETSTGGTVASRTWDLGNGVIIPNGPITVGANYFTPQVYTIVLTVVFTNGVTNSKTDYVTVHPKPIANFNSIDSVGCAPHNATFLSTSSTTTGSLTNYQWDFGAGGLSGTNPNPSFLYTTTGQYQVSLIVKNNWGCVSDAVTKPQYIKVYNSPNAYFTVNPSFTCANSFTAIFTNASSGGDPSRNTFEWDFGDGSTVVTTTNATHTYTGTGNYIATLKVKLGNTCVSTYSYTIYVGKPTPTITVFPADVCVNTPINYIGTGSANTYYLRWFFPDNGQTQYYGNVTHTFTTTGTFELLLIARNYAGCEDTVKQSVQVKSGPIINFTPNFPDANCKPHTVTFTNNTIGNDLKFAWNYGDGFIDTINGQGNAIHTYTNFNYYTVTVYAIDTSITGGCFAYKTYNYIRVLQPSISLNVIPPSGCKPLPVNFTASVGNNVVPILSYSWDFGEGNPPTVTTVPSIAHTYINNGVFTTSVTITMQGGCTYTSLLKTVTVIDLCDDDGSGGGGAGGGGFTIGKTCADKYTILFSDTVSNSTVLSWDFGDGTPIVNTGILNPISHTFTPPQKIYTVTVTRKNNTTNVISTGQKSVKIIDEKANFIPNLFDICKDKNVLFKTIGIDSSLIKNYTWDFGDGTPRFVINNALYFSYYGVYLNGNTNHTYTTNGIFYVKLIIEDKLGCKDSLQYILPINVAGPIARFTGGPLTSCTSPLTTTFLNGSTPNGVTPIIEWQWTFGDGATLTTTVDSLIPHIYTGAAYVNFYTVKLKVKDAIGCESDTTRTNYVKIYKPKADFFSYNTLQCNNYNIFLYNNSSAYNASFKWYYGDGTSSVGYYGSHTYATDGDYDIKLVATDENGCMDSITRTSYIKLVKPKADFKISDTLQCAPASITFADSSKYATSYVWDFGDGSGPSTSPNPAPHIYGTPGYYNVKLKIVGVSGCIDSIVKQIRVRGPIATLNVVSGSGCKPYSLQLKATGSFINTYAWDYGDGSPVSANTMDSIVTHLYNNAGKYLPNIVLTSPEGCPYTLKVTDTIIVDSLKTKFTIPQTVFCQVGITTTVSFNNLSTVPGFSSILYNNWSFGDGTIVNDASPIVTHTYTGYGTFNVYLATKSKYGCIDTFKLFPAITINAKPIPAIVGNNVYCLKPASILQYTGTIISPDPIVKYKWKIDADSVANTQSLNINYRTPGVHTLKYIVTTNKGCVDSITKTIIIDSVLTKFDLTPTQFCGPKLISFTDQSTNASNIQNLRWTFGDGTFETTNINPQHLYTNTGTYDVKLYLQTTNGCKDSLTKFVAVTIDSIPKANIIGANVFCLKPNSMVQFNSSIITQNPIANYKWYIDGVQVATSINLNIDYRIAGLHNVKLYVETSKGCTDEITKPFIVDSVVTKFDLTPAQFCGPKLISFTDQSTNASSIQNFAWTFGDGTFETTNINPQHLYTNTGTYDVKLYLQTTNGCKDSLTKFVAVTIDSIPKANIIGTNVFCLKPNSMVQFNSSIITQNPIANYKWYIDGVQVATSINLNIDYRIAGAHIVKLFVETSKGCTDEITKPFIIDSVLTKFDLTPAQFCGPKLISFSDQSTNASTIQNFAWTFGDGTFETTNINPQHLYTNTGVYDVKLYLQTTNGCKDSLTKFVAVTIDSIPKAVITGDALKCKPDIYSYISSNSIMPDVISNYEWKVDGILISTTPSLNHYFNAGNHVISFYMKSIKGCESVITKSIVVDSIKAAFSVINPIRCADDVKVQFVNNSGSKFGINTYAWDFGDGTTSSAINPPIHTYPGYGNYNVKLITTSVNGCIDSFKIIPAVIIHPQPAANIIGDSIHCKPGLYNYNSNINSIDAIQNYEWKVNGNLVNATPNLNYLFAAGNYTVSLKVKTINNCINEITKIIIVDSIKSNFSITNPVRCGNNNLAVQFNNLSGAKFSIASYLWNFGDGQTSTNINPLHTYNTVGTYTIKLIATSIHGCTDTFEFPSPVIIYATPIVTVTNIAEKCMNNNIAFTSQVQSQDVISSYLWKVNGVTAGTTNALNYYFTVANNYVVTLEVNTQNGCTVIETKNVTIRPLPIPQAAPNINICEGSSISLIANDGNSFLWSPITTLQNPNSATPIATPVVDTKYYVTVTNQYGCVQIDSVLIKVDKKVNLITPPSVATCRGTAVQLTASGNTNNFMWSPTTGLSNPNSASTSANPNNTTQYQIIGVSNNVCKSDTGFVTVTVGDIPTVDLGPNLQITAGTPVTLNPSTTGGVTQYIWTPSTGLSCTNCPQTLFIADKNITYKVQVKTQYDCTATDEVDIIVLCGKGSIYVPSGFTPNNDNKNDVFYVMGYGITKIKKFSVFDRWGKRVFYKENTDANNPAYGWDGRVNNQEVTTSTTFVYYIEVECAEGKSVLLKNTIVLVK
jgi:gliding motility-associated-like protein